MQFTLNPFREFKPSPFLTVADRQIPVAFIRNTRARRYLLRLREDGSARVTVPRGGSFAEAQRFVERNHDWLARQLHLQTTRPRAAQAWHAGTEIYLQGELTKLALEECEGKTFIRVGGELTQVADPGNNLRAAVEKYLWRLAAKELPPKVIAFAAQHQSVVRRISVRNQRSRWGSCSRRGTISLNWRLIQTPPFVQDYIILHELMHLRQMNHSPKFWREVESVCPDYPAAERWLKQHSARLR